MNITSTDKPRHSREEAKADAVALKESMDNSDNITAHVHTAIPHKVLLEEGQFTGYIIVRS